MALPAWLCVTVAFAAGCYLLFYHYGTPSLSSKYTYCDEYSREEDPRVSAWAPSSRGIPPVRDIPLVTVNRILYRRPKRISSYSDVSKLTLSPMSTKHSGALLFPRVSSTSSTQSLLFGRLPTEEGKRTSSGMSSGSGSGSDKEK
jgi:hypothetical protein